jgi:hypothetical protein
MRMIEAQSLGLQHQEGFEKVLSEMGEVRLDKCNQYGEERYDQSKWTAAEETWMIFSDVFRKFIRLRQQVRRNDRKGMRETLLDLANYAAMGVQLIDQRGESNESIV